LQPAATLCPHIRHGKFFQQSATVLAMLLRISIAALPKSKVEAQKKKVAVLGFHSPKSKTLRLENKSGPSK
jgi:hypothetical protein